MALMKKKAPRAVRKALTANLTAKQANLSKDLKDSRAKGANTVSESQGNKAAMIRDARNEAVKAGVSPRKAFKAIEKGSKAAYKEGGANKTVSKAYDANVKASAAVKKVKAKEQVKAAKTYTKPYNAKKGK